MNYSKILPGGLLATALLVANPVFGSEAPAADPPPPARAIVSTPAVVSVNRADPLKGLENKTLHFVAETPDAAANALRMAGSTSFARGASASGTLAVNPPLAVYYLNTTKMANGEGLDSANRSGINSYVIMDSGQPYATIGVQVPDTGAPRAVSTRYTAQNAGRPDEATLAIQALPALAALEQVKKGSYEVRLIGSRPPIAFSAIWLKSDSAGGDFIYPLSDPGELGLAVHQLYTSDEFLKAYKPYLRKRMQLPAEDPLWASDDQMHAYFVKMFIASNGFGKTRMGVPQMALQDGMQLNLPTKTGMEPHSYGVDSIELIGIAKHKPPVAFVDKRHGSDSTDFPTRGLTDFEQKALAQLNTGTNVVAQLNGDNRIVVGAIRAEESCLDCHPGAHKGDVLGAFSYHLTSITPPSSLAAQPANIAKP